MAIASRACLHEASRTRLRMPQSATRVSGIALLFVAAAQAGDAAAVACLDHRRVLQASFQRAHACQLMLVPHVQLEVMARPLETVAERAPVSCLGGTKLLQSRQHAGQAACSLGGAPFGGKGWLCS